MDSLTQAALGASVGFLCWHRELGRKALVAGAVLATIPDLDIVAYPFLDSISRLYWHRGESHSIFFVLVGALLSGWLIKRMVRSNIITLRSACLGAFFIYASHVLIDVFTIYGTQLLAPVSRHGYGLGNMFIIDPIFTLILVSGIVAAGFASDTGKRGNAYALCCAGLYSLWSLGMQWYADTQFRQATKDLDITISRRLTTAAPFTTFLWRHVAEVPGGYLMGYWSLFDAKDRVIQFSQVPQNEAMTETLRQQRSFQAIDWFSQGWWVALPESSHSLRVIDIRFTEIPSSLNQPFAQLQWPFSWSFATQVPGDDRLRSVQPAAIDFTATLELLAERIGGGSGWLQQEGILTSYGTTSTGQ